MKRTWTIVVSFLGLLLLSRAVVVGQASGVSTTTIARPSNLVECNPSGTDGQVFIPVSIHTGKSFFSGPWEVEPNSPYLLANGPIQAGQDYFGYPNDFEDFWSLFLVSPGEIKINLTDFSANGGQLQLYYQAVTPSNKVAEDLIPPLNLHYTGPAGLYFLFIPATSGWNSAYKYTLKAEFPAGKDVQQINTPTPNPIAYRAEWVGYNFESGTENWVTSEGAYKLAKLDTSDQVVCAGRQSLRLTTELYIDPVEVYRHTEAVAYFGGAVPQGMPNPGPYDLTGKEVSCYVWVPASLVSQGDPETYIKLFVKDEAFHNQYSTALDITEDAADSWQYLSLTITNGLDGFDATKTNALGVRIELQPDSALRFEGPIYIDECRIEQP